MVKTAVVILNWNGLAFLKQFLPSVIRYTKNSETAVIVADNGSTDGSTDWIEREHPEAAVIKNGSNLGFAGGYNASLQNIEAEYFVLLNSDIEVTDGWLSPLISFMDSHPEAAACQPKILSYKNRDCFEHAGAAGCYIDKYGYPFCRGRIFNITEKDHGQYDTVAETFWGSGACLVIRSSAWKKCGGFDKDFFAHMEEIDLCWRFQNAGYKVFYYPGSVVYHVGGGSLPYSSPFKIYLNFRNSLFMLYKNLPEEKLHSMMFKRRLLDGLAAMFFILTGSIRGAWSVFIAHMHYYSSLKSLKKKREGLVNNGKLINKNIILNKSIVYEFYVKGNKDYNSLIKNEEKK